ncbi:tryptophan synthase subunit beta [Tessaracoccus flavus]|uniref:Tryptophan synthase beta chain n=1 Tax=Tessaracoccus flavus TaxID=1610493 RepID=A0A1Q2CFD3_9ACTN|nr:tryptophan synthase subunit beta [Tessaracoccus flavus]AQP44826.1 tryptophan synthase subunit beta [Tessaracoccus flavus]SDY96329.1 tryptophan synthase beta chain [Tessaracoccus flavus]
MSSLIHADDQGFFGDHGGRFVPPQLEAPIAEVAEAYAEARDDPEFLAEYEALLTDYVGRPSPLFFAKRLTAELGGARIYLKREDLNHTGAHKINHCLGEALLAKRMGKRKLIAETGAGQHGVALATAAALLGLECEIHMGAIDVAKQHPNVVRMELLGAKVVAVEEGGRSLKEAVDSAFAVFASDYADTFFAIGSVVGPHPYPTMVRDFQSVVGREARQQCLDKIGRLPDALIAAVGGGSNALGLFTAFLEDDSVAIYGVEPGGRSLDVVGEHAATMTLGREGTLHGMKTLVLQDADGEPSPVHSIASGLDYPGIGPQHAHLRDVGRVEYVTASDQDTLDAFQLLCRTEGIIPALESCHAVAHAMKLAPTLDAEQVIIVNLSGRGDKDIDYVAERLGVGTGSSD